MSAPKLPCGHPSSYHNFKRDSRGTRYCVKCRSENATSTLRFPCGHQRHDNTTRWGVKDVCRLCYNARRTELRRARVGCDPNARRTYDNSRRSAPFTLAVRVKLDLSTDVDVIRYREEKFRRENTPEKSAKWREIEAAWEQSKIDQAAAQKGGRPRGARRQGNGA